MVAVTDDSAVTWTALPDRESDRLRLLVFHLGAGVVGVVGLLIVAALVALAVGGDVGGDTGTLLLVGVLLFVGGPMSLWYLRLASTHGTEGELGTLLPNTGWVRRRYLPVAVVGGPILLLPLALQPGLLLAYPLAFVAARWAVDLRYTVGRLDPAAGRLRCAVGAAAVEHGRGGRLDPNERPVRTCDLTPLRRVHRRQIGSYTLFFLRYRRRGWWGRPLLLVVPSEAAERVEQIFFTVSDSDKAMVLINFLQRDEVSRAIVFANRRDQTRDLEDKLRRHGVRSALLSGEIPQNKRISTLNRFKEGDVRVLVATDVAARGIHVEDVSHVFNFNLPDNPEDYVHRIGRTGRAGASGTSVTLAGEDDSFVLPDLENYLNQSLTFVRPPDPLMVPLAEPAEKPEPKQSGGGDGKAGRQRNRNRNQRREEDASG